MDFTYKEYIRIIELCKKNYFFTTYKEINMHPKEVILRHDIDMDIDKAIALAKIEKEHNVRSTYFILVTSNLYNIANKYVRDSIANIAKLGHSIGLHFDETQYAKEEIYHRVKQEKDMLEKIVGHNIIVDSVSMHIPSRKTLEANYDFGNDIINSYSENFFHEWKYISDSNMRWREDPFEVISSCQYSKLHILTHPIWYDEDLLLKEKKLFNFYKKKKAKLRLEINTIAP